MLICSSCDTENPDGAKFCNECATSLDASASPHAFRKIVTALFCDLVGSTTLGEQHDPEVLRPIFERYFTEMRSAVERHGGEIGLSPHEGGGAEAWVTLPISDRVS